MITAVETTVLLDILTADSSFGELSKAALRQDLQSGKVIACEVTLAEAGAFFPSYSAFLDILTKLNVEFSPMDLESCHLAGSFWKKYRARGGTRTRIISDFLIGAHALRSADQLLTRDRGFYRTYFKRLKIHDPSRM
jgi:hypothetical protein